MLYSVELRSPLRAAKIRVATKCAKTFFKILNQPHYQKKSRRQRDFVLIVFYFFAVTLMIPFIVGDVRSFCVLLFTAAAVNVVLVLRPRGPGVWHRFVLPCAV